MKEAFNGLDLAPGDPELVAGKPLRSLNACPELTGFRKTALAYYNACAALGARLHRDFARDLVLTPDFFTAKFDRAMAILRFLHYPASKLWPQPPAR
jgi:isopenicillin N synthase-like dioxygenase